MVCTPGNWHAPPPTTKLASNCPCHGYASSTEGRGAGRDGYEIRAAIDAPLAAFASVAIWFFHGSAGPWLVAFGVLHVLERDGLFDDTFIAQHTVGYDELAERASTYTPEFAAQETGIPVEDIVKLAREYATTPPAVVRIGVAVERHAGGGQTVRAIA